jgi:hypothetical protein
MIEDLAGGKVGSVHLPDFVVAGAWEGVALYIEGEWSEVWIYAVASIYFFLSF